MKYRREVDGLRAVALLPVICFHAGFPGFRGGYVGVDVFFVISGFLITSILVAEQDGGRYSLASFYERRARRILPALFFVMLACLPAAWLLMFPYQLQDFSKALIAVMAFSANLLFVSQSLGMQERDYFAPTSEDNPMLHMWSLAVEEQYYLVFPVFLGLFWFLGKRRLAALTFLIALTSLAVAEWGWRHHPTANFFLPPGRVWELLLGGLLAFASVERPIGERVSATVRQALSLLGLVLIVVSVFAFDERTPFPSIYALVPTIGAALVIGFAREGTAAHRLLSTRALVGIGLVSYSGYLWHQPLFAFARLASEAPPSPLVFAALGALSLLIAWVSWRFVERPFRDRTRFTRVQVFAGSAVGLLLFCSLGAAGAVTHGWAERYNAEEQTMLGYLNSRPPEYREGTCFLTPTVNPGAFDARCLLGLSGRTPTLIWGDSHAASIAVGFRRLAPEDTAQMDTSSCPPLLGFATPDNPQCALSNAAVVAALRGKQDVRVLMAADWSFYVDKPGFDAAFEQTVTTLQGLGARIVVVGPLPQWEPSLPEDLASVMYKTGVPLAGLHRDLGSKRYVALRSADRRLAALSARHGVGFVSVLDAICDEDRCRALVPGPTVGQIVPLAWDHAHLTVAGSIAIAEALLPALARLAP